MRSSASRERIQSPVAASRARFFWGPNPGQSGVTITFAPKSLAISAVPSVLPESTTIHSSAKATLSRQAWMWVASFFVMMTTDSFISWPGRVETGL